MNDEYNTMGIVIARINKLLLFTMLIKLIGKPYYH